LHGDEDFQNEHETCTAGTYPLFSPKNFFAECKENYRARAANSIGKIYALAAMRHFSSVTQILKPPNTRVPQKLRGIVGEKYKNSATKRPGAMNLKGKVVIVTGGSSGIGRAAAIAVDLKGVWLGMKYQIKQMRPRAGPSSKSAAFDSKT
jgi:UDP-N-acetylglucosamine:LPS N-acetylglucosamine transferase